jgi:hypothetical protein
MKKPLLFVLALGAITAAIVVAHSGDEDGAKPAPTAKLPANRHDPEDRAANGAGSASTGASLPKRALPPEPRMDTEPARGTDLGKEADREDEAFRKRRLQKP